MRPVLESISTSPSYASTCSHDPQIAAVERDPAVAANSSHEGDLEDGMSYRVAVLAGDGVGPEVIAEARKAVDALELDIEWTDLPWGSRYYHEHGEMMPPDGFEIIRANDAVLLGAIGDPSVPDDVTLWGLLLPLRQRLDLWVNLRPARLLDGVPSPLAAAPPLDIVFVRENTEGEYAGVGGRAHRGLEIEVALETSVFTRAGIERAMRYAFEMAASRRGKLTSATKSNASRYGYVLWDEIAEELAEEFEEVAYERVLVDALAARLIQDPLGLDVVVASNLFGDILTDIAAALQGGLGMAASANISPGSRTPAVFEPVHGSAPDIAGRGIANPLGAIWSASLMLDHLGEPQAAAKVMAAIEAVCRDGTVTRDLGGNAETREVGDAVVARIRGS
jgi:tartrate dehydrogenase/decarboxylase / D-malate dehydrogenase